MITDPKIAAFLSQAIAISTVKDGTMLTISREGLEILRQIMDEKQQDRVVVFAQSEKAQ